MSEMAREDAAPRRCLCRSKSNRIIAGVCGGLGEYLGVDPTVVRLAFVLLALFGGGGIFLYLILWLVMPEEGGPARFASAETVRRGALEMRGMAAKAKEQVERDAEKDETGRRRRGGWGALLLGGLLMLAGTFFLSKELGVSWFLNDRTIWPVVLIFAGLAFIARKFF